MSERYWPQFNVYTDSASMSHISRYLLARGFIQSGEKVVDVACGIGYGSSLLADVAGHVIAFDKDDCFDPKYARDNLRFHQCDIEFLPGLASLDTVVSLETIEHLKEPRLLLDWVDKNAKKKFIVSSPNKPTTETNSHHLSDVTFATLMIMMKDYPDWTLYQVFYHDVYYIAVFVRKDKNLL